MQKLFIFARSIGPAGRVAPQHPAAIDAPEVAQRSTKTQTVAKFPSCTGGQGMDRSARTARQNTTAIAVGAALLSLAIVAGAPAQAQTFSGFDGGKQYDTGFNPSVAISYGNIVEVHNGTSSAGPLWYKRGSIGPSSMDVSWYYTAYPFESNGFNPSVAVIGNFVIEVHNSGNSAGPLYYRTGTLDDNGGTITWNNPAVYDPNGGFNPQIAVGVLEDDTTVVVEVHNGGNGVGPLWYRTGIVNFSANTISWNDSHEFDSYSTNPSVAVFSDGTVIEVHNDNDTPGGPLWYRYGTLNLALEGLNETINYPTITFSASATTYGSGWNPKIAALGYQGPNGNGIEVHNGNTILHLCFVGVPCVPPPPQNFLYYDVSGLSNGPVYYAEGNNPSVAIGIYYDDPLGVIEANCSAPQLWTIEVMNYYAGGYGPLYYHVGRWPC